jgi:hypothetical protein
MHYNVAEWVAMVTQAKLERLRSGNLLAEEQLRRSYQQIVISKELLRRPVPRLWHPEPFKE